MPTDWSEQLKAEYPKRSGPCGWAGMRLMLAVRRALNVTDWESIMNGVRGYARYCEKAGKTGSEFVKAPLSFFEEGIYAEELDYQEPQDPKIAAAKQKEQERWALVRRDARGIEPHPLESLASFETRVRLARDRGAGNLRETVVGNERDGQIHSLVSKMRITK